ncbi:thyrotropin-releasing hormone receptor [Elysia marginata]|uniref:Thyrotropin-releasing hormone receptor n=1 Tax=Elysia marginata TaxID=1093978 RepID=A0AAV4GRG5_9GAST|nr:thyrotropin-releasing hormone receptor [Elysia marginata]
MTRSNLSFQLHGFEYSLVYLQERQEAQEISRVAEAIQRYYLWVIAGVGIPANILAIIGVLSLGRLLPPSLLLLLLSITDAITLLLKLVANQVYIHDPHMTTLACRLEFVVISFSTLANWILVGVTVDRFLWLYRKRALRNADTQPEDGQGCEATEKITEKRKVSDNGKGEDTNDGCQYVFFKMLRKDEIGIEGLTNRGVCLASLAAAFLIMLLYGIVFFIMRDVDRTGTRCVVYNKYAEFWKNGWYWINTSLFFFFPFIVILILTVISVRWLLIDKREASKIKQQNLGEAVELEKQGVNSDDQSKEEAEVKADIIKSQAPTENQTENGASAANDENGKSNDSPQDDSTCTTKEAKTKEIEESKPGSPTKAGYGSQGPERRGPLEYRYQTAFTAMMILAAAFFLVLSLPGCVFYLSYRVKTDPTLKAKWLLFEQMQHILVDMSHALNFFIYFVAVKVFRDNLIRVITCK